MVNGVLIGIIDGISSVFAIVTVSSPLAEKCIGTNISL